MIAKRTAWKLEELPANEADCGMRSTNYGFTWTATEKITCEVTGEMDTGTKVWTDIKTGEQYFMFRMQRISYFVHI